MQRAIQTFTERLLATPLPFFALYGVSVLLLTIISLITPIMYWWEGLVIPIAAFFIGEILLRAYLRIAYGKEYRYAIFTYFLTDDPRYGTGLRKNADTRKIPFRLFGVFVFPPKVGRVLDLEENKKKRNLFSVNSLGFRGPEFDPEHKKARLRIFCTGGSTTACDSNNDDETWPAQLGKHLRENGYDVEVINAGVQGWYSYKEFLRFRDEIANYQADVVLAHQGWNGEFVYSSLGLGTHWRPKLLRNVREEHMLYCPPNRFLSSDRFLFKFLLIKALRWKYVFKRTMNFENPNRWRSLLRREYIAAWVENMLSMADIAAQKQILFYTVDYPGLVSLSDTRAEREVYVASSRLTPLFADYQAVSKARIARTLSRMAPVIPCIKAEEDFKNHKSMERVALFHDEVHLTPPGNALLGRVVAERLMGDKAFIDRYQNGVKQSNVTLRGDVINEARQQAGVSSRDLERFVTDSISRLEHKKDKDADNIPQERYTTF